jgi:hypothetical protein
MISKNRYASPRLQLEMRAVSPGAKALVAHCLTSIILPSLTVQQKRSRSLPAIERATEGLLGGLVALRDAQWARRPMSETSFIGGPGISRGQFVKVLAALEGAGLIERNRSQFEEGELAPKGRETRIRLTQVGRALAGAYRVAAKDFGERPGGVEQ